MSLGTLTRDLYPALPDLVVDLLIYALLAHEAGDEPRPWCSWGEA